MSQDVTYTSQTCHKSLDGEFTIFQHVTTRHISSLYKLGIYFTLRKSKCDVLLRIQIQSIHNLKGLDKCVTCMWRVVTRICRPIITFQVPTESWTFQFFSIHERDGKFEF